MNLEKLNEFVDIYMKYMNSLEKDNENKRKERKEYYQSFDYNKIKVMEENELVDYLKKLWCVLPISIKNIINKNGLDKFKDNLANLLYGNEDISIRYDKFYSNIDIFKASAMSEVLTYNFPNEYIIWDNKVKTVFEWLGLKDLPISADNMTFNDYSRMINYGKEIRDRISSKLNKTMDLLDADYFYHVVFVIVNQKNMANSFDVNKYSNLLEKYKNDFYEYRKDELYKWEAIFEFQKNWDLDAEDFHLMLKKALSKAENLLTSHYYYPGGMIIDFAEYEPETVRNMFKLLFNENVDIITRITEFQEVSESLLKKYFEPGKNSFQDLHTISVYLTFKYPDKYYLFKSTIAKKASKLLDVNISNKNKIIELFGYFELCDSLKKNMQKDEELLEMSKKSLNENCYSDNNYNILVSDFIYYCGSKTNEEELEWEPSDYDPGISIEDWAEILNDQQFTSENVLKVLKRFKDYGGEATCKELSLKYGGDPGFYNIVSSKFGQAVYKYTNCNIVESDNENSKWWPVLFWGRYASREQNGSYVWKLRDELSKALERIDLSMIELYEKENRTEWIIPANPNYYDHISSFEKNGFIDWSQNVKYNVGDIVYLYTTAPEKRISAMTEVEKIDLTIDEKIDDSEFNKDEFLDKKRDDRNRFVRLKLVKYIDDERLGYDELLIHGLKGNVQSATKVRNELSNYINFVLNGVNNNELFESVNVIYYGGPGCGKSKFVEDNYCGNDNYIRTTFYPDYTNSDFIGQLIPKYDKAKEKLIYEINPGPFTKAIEMAYKNTNKNIYLIIEEINRGNAAAIFGDTFQLLDRVTNVSDKDIGRKNIGESEYEISNNIIEEYIHNKLNKDISGKVKIPANMSIISTMNTSDQNVYTLDSAFKRRWKMKHITNKFTDADYDKLIGDKYVPMKNCDIKWSEFVERINKAIVSINTFGINSEDKQIGKYFVGTSDLLDSKINIEEYESYEPAVVSFSEKVLMYLWEDIAKLEPTEWFDEEIKTLDELLKRYKIDGIKVFSNNIKERLIVENDGEVDEQ